MSKILLVAAAFVALLCASPGYAAFTVSGQAEAVFVANGSGTFLVNKIEDDGDIFTTTSMSPPSESEFTETFSGDFRAYFVNAGRSSQDPGFAVTFDLPIVGIVATNGFAQLIPNLLAGFETETGINISSAIGGIFNDANNSLVGTGSEALEIYQVNPSNPDTLSVSGNVVSGSVNSLLSADNEGFIVLTAIPEPGTVAVWSLCGLCGLVAGRRRMKRQS